LKPGGKSVTLGARHSVEEFAGDLTDLEIEIRPPRAEQIALRLSNYAQNYAREDPISAQIHLAPPNIENKNPSSS